MSNDTEASGLPYPPPLSPGELPEVKSFKTSVMVQDRIRLRELIPHFIGPKKYKMSASPQQQTNEISVLSQL